jgi:hypothetical protein
MHGRANKKLDCNSGGEVVVDEEDDVVVDDDLVVVVSGIKPGFSA